MHSKGLSSHGGRVRLAHNAVHHRESPTTLSVGLQSCTGLNIKTISFLLRSTFSSAYKFSSDCRLWSSAVTISMAFFHTLTTLGTKHSMLPPRIVLTLRDAVLTNLIVCSWY